MNDFHGEMLSGELSQEDHAFYLTQFKHLATQSTLSDAQLKHLYDYLLAQREKGESCTITLNDQIPILLRADEINAVVSELDTVMEKL